MLNAAGCIFYFESGNELIIVEDDVNFIEIIKQLLNFVNY